MKTSIVPAQVTSIEDTVTAKLSLTQIVLLILPVFIAAIVFAALPPLLHIKLYKLILTGVITVPTLLLALRIRGQLVLSWLIMLSAYRYRPHRYILTKSEVCNCAVKEIDQVEDETNISPLPVVVNNVGLAPAEYLRVNNFLKGRQVIYFADSEGQLNAVIETK